MYTVTRYEASISVEDYLEGYVDIPTFLKACQACPNYGQVWSCPPYDFDVLEYWRQYQTLRLLAAKIEFNKEMTAKTYTREEISSIINAVLPKEKQKLSEELFALERQHPGSISLSAGSCNLCKNGCAKKSGLPCRYPKTMRYSIEALGGNVGLTIEKLMGLKLEWMEEGRLPGHFVLVSGLLQKE